MEIQKGLELSRERLAIQAVSLREAAKIACLSPFHFHRLFTATYQCSPHAFATQVRIDHAKRLLLESDLSISEKGVKFRGEPKEEFYGTEVVLEDPFGNWFSFCQRKH